jgi:hypothetical protein
VEAFRLAVELIEWLGESGFGREDAYALAGRLAERTVASTRVGNLVTR